MGNKSVPEKNTSMSVENIQGMIFTIRGVQVMVDRDIAIVYGVTTKVLNQAVKRNSERFPEEFRFQLNDTEKNELVTNCDRFDPLKHSSVNPYVFAEQGFHARGDKKQRLRAHAGPVRGC